MRWLTAIWRWLWRPTPLRHRTYHCPVCDLPVELLSKGQAYWPPAEELIGLCRAQNGTNHRRWL
jgi:hypothetical protein